jgi:hypothetical protein
MTRQTRTWRTRSPVRHARLKYTAFAAARPLDQSTDLLHGDECATEEAQRHIGDERAALRRSSALDAASDS